jgi:hypothetical protein
VHPASDTEKEIEAHLRHQNTGDDSTHIKTDPTQISDTGHDLFQTKDDRELSIDLDLDLDYSDDPDIKIHTTTPPPTTPLARSNRSREAAAAFIAMADEDTEESNGNDRTQRAGSGVNDRAGLGGLFSSERSRRHW